MYILSEESTIWDLCLYYITKINLSNWIQIKIVFSILHICSIIIKINTKKKNRDTNLINNTLWFFLLNYCSFHNRKVKNFNRVSLIS